MSTVEEKYLWTTAEDSIAEKDWAAGSAKQLDVKEFIIRKVGSTLVGSYETVRYAPAWWKIIDEPIVNALDHLVNNLGTNHPVTTIKVGFDKTGRVRVYNDGPGVEVVVHKEASKHLGKETYVPTVVFGTLFQGSNRKRASDSIVGGTNGLGAKLSNCFSTEFIVETVDETRRQYFIQKWTNNKKIEGKPVVVDLSHQHSLAKDRTIPHTTLSFVPDYKGSFGYDVFDDNVYNSLVDVVRTRTVFAAAYAYFAVSNSGKPQQLNVYFNDELINVKSMADIAKILFPGRDHLTVKVAPAIDPKAKSRVDYRYPWEVCAVLINTSSMETGQLSNINGVVVREGKHTKHILNGLCDGVKDKISKIFHDKNLKFSPSYVNGNLFMLINSQIPHPAWTGQRKDVMDTDIRKFAGYILDQKFINDVSAKLRDQIVEGIFNEPATPGSKNKTKQSEYEKYTKAKKAGGKSSLKCSLVAVEGDSAKARVEMGIAKTIGFDFYGVISLGGVIMNARKECTVVETSNGKFVKKSTKLTNNVFMNVLMEVTGLNPAYKYDPKSPTYKKEMSELNYGCIVACVDQDLDGKGFILGLLLNTFDLFWPNLLSAGYIKWFCTPIIRAYPNRGGTIIPFYSIHEYDSWAATVNTNLYDIKYYKGLGTHERDETIHMFKDFHKNLYTYYTDERSRELFEIYFGDSSELRKKELSQPTRLLSKERQMAISKTKMMSCSEHLEVETNLFQKDNLERKLDHVIDGQNQSGRKILDGMIKALTSKKEMKVAQLSGYVSENENYHHGEASLNNSITGKGLVTVGGKQLPFIVPRGNFGSRKGGGDDASSARYIFAKLNKKITSLIFPNDDYHILPFNFDEGERSEPKYFVPIIPMAVCESAELPAHGWKLKLWARDVFKVIENVRRLIRCGDNVALMRMPPATYKGSPYEWKGEFKTVRGDINSFGKYTIDEDKNILRITELPLRVWITPYVNMLRKKASRADNIIIAGIHDASDDISVNIEVKLKPGALGLLDEYKDSYFADGVEEFFQLRERMDSHINLYGMNNEIIMFESYEAVMHHWFPVRKEYYAKRIARESVLLQLDILLHENIIRYIEQSNALGLSKRKYADMVQSLENDKYNKIHSARISNPGFTPTEELETVVLSGPDADYDYLLDLSDRKKSDESLTKYKESLTKLQDQLSELSSISAEGRFIGAKIWERELDALEVAIVEGQKTFWKYGDASKYKFE